MPIHVSYLDDRSVLCIADKENWQRRLARMTRAQYLITKKGGWTQFDHLRKRTTYTAMGCFKYDYDALGHRSLYSCFSCFLFFLDWHSDQHIMGIEPSWSVRRWWPPS
ncbi:hypothetical protein GGI42DRAFT_37229 [Trichoderma sp. SZMC 28013]